MRKLLLALSLFFLISTLTKASHVVGGEIGWKCTNSGEFIFFMKVFRDCTGIDYPFDNKTIEIISTPLPRDVNNNTINQIILKPDSNWWINNRRGDTSPECCGLQGYSCQQGNEGIIQQFQFLSDQIRLKGTPPTSGWQFNHQHPCCRTGNMANVMGGTAILRSVMYSDNNNSPVDHCYDSSPQFLELPVSSLCRDQLFTYNPAAIDYDYDSLVYSFDRSYNSPTSNPQALSFKSGYSATSPMPSVAMDSNNIPLSLDSNTGFMQVKTASGVGARKYLVVVKVDAYRGAKILSTTFREIPFTVFDCVGDTLFPDNKSTPPVFMLNDSAASNYTIEVEAGQQINYPIALVDYDSIYKNQALIMEPRGQLLATDMQNQNWCEDTSMAPCAYFSSNIPIFQNSVSPPRWRFEDTNSIQTRFIWNTTCKHALSNGTLSNKESTAIYNFSFRTLDVNCPIPGVNYPTFSIKIKSPIALESPTLKGISLGLDGVVKLAYIPPAGLESNFINYLMLLNGIAYDSSYHFNRQVLLNPNQFFNYNGSQVDVLNLKVNSQLKHSLRTNSKTCADTSLSELSNEVNIMRLKAFADTSDLSDQDFTLRWNRMTTSSSANIFEYESQTYVLHLAA